MSISLRSLGLLCPCLPALLFVCVAPGSAFAQSLRFRNETSGVVVLQATSVVKGRVLQGPQFRLGPNELTPPLMLPGNKIITIYDNPRNPTRILFQGTIPESTEDQSFGIVADTPAPRVKIEARRLPAPRP